MNIDTTQFTAALWEYYAAHGRHDLPWRQPDSDGSFDPYKIMVSEIMLQQTRVARVIPKYHEFLITFPNVKTLAAAPLGAVLMKWSGLGYNRRAKFLWQAAQTITDDFAGQVPSDEPALISLSGVGVNTAGAIVVYGFNQPTIFIETNIRTVYIHHFFRDHTDVPDVAIRELLQTTLHHEQPREFYWALMDYGSHLKQTVGNVSKHSANYSKQSAFAGSKRQLRGQVLSTLAGGQQTKRQLHKSIGDERLDAVLTELVNEKLIKKSRQYYTL